MPLRTVRSVLAAGVLVVGAAGGLAGQTAAAASPAAAAGRSLLVPGWGQWAQGQRRGILYALAEVGLWALWADRRSSATDLRNAYRDLAWETARGASGSRVDGPWSYYENMSRWTRSGAWDADGALPGLQPEADPATFNGSQWRLAREIHFGGGEPGPGDARYEAALAYYRAHAYGPGFLWDWTDRDPSRREFVNLIDRSDERFRQATTALGAVLANHLLSSADAFVSAQLPGEVRLRVAPAGVGDPFLAVTLTWRPMP